MDLDQCGQSRSRGQRMKAPQLRIAQDCDDQQNCVRAPLNRLQNLPVINDEFLPQQGQFHRCADLLQVIQRPLEELLVGKHR